MSAPAPGERADTGRATASEPAPEPNGGPAPRSGLLARNVLQFGRLLRHAGLPVGPGTVLDAQRALLHVDLGSRQEVRAALRAVTTDRREQQEVFDQAFALFWRDPAAASHAALSALLDGKPPEEPKPKPGSRRVAEAAAPPRLPPKTEDAAPQLDAAMTVSEREQLQTMDFEAMSAEQVLAAKAEIRRLVLPLDRQRTRRLRPHPEGHQVALRETLRRTLRTGGELLELGHVRRVTRPPPLVVLCDISGSMTRYAQILLHFLHAVANERGRVHVFLFGTRLSNVTRQLRHRDAEVAFQMVAHAVPDWSGGTRIGEAIGEFNRRWARRVLGQGAVVLLVTDGLDREGAAGLSEEMDRLHRSCRRLVWLNPLLRWSGFQPRSQGIRAMLPHVDEFRTVHSLASLRSLVEALSRPAPPRPLPGRGPKEWRTAA